MNRKAKTMQHQNTRQFEKSLLVFGRKLVDEMRYINYPKEWSRKPLIDLVPLFVELLDYHPERLGSVLGVAIEGKKFNVNQLSTISILRKHDVHTTAFSDTLENWSYEHEVGGLPKEEDVVKDDEIEALLRKIIGQFHDTLTALDASQENEHRTLERAGFALEPVFQHISGLHGYGNNMGWDMIEYLDFWRNLTTAERKDFARKNQLYIG